jgi:hypothetical protein
MPTSQGRFEYTDEAVKAIEKSLSPERLAKYISAAQGNKKRAIQLYERNTALSEALYGVIQGLEIALRNALHNTLRKELGLDDWYDYAGLEEKEIESVQKAKDSLTNWGKTATPGRVIAELTLGFWVQLTSKKYEKALWVKYLYRAFPIKLNRKVLFQRLDNIKRLRNRIAHHEPIFSRNLKQDYLEIIETIKWICLTTSEWVERTNCFEERFNAPLP